MSTAPRSLATLCMTLTALSLAIPQTGFAMAKKAAREQQPSPETPADCDLSVQAREIVGYEQVNNESPEESFEGYSLESLEESFEKDPEKSFKAHSREYSQRLNNYKHREILEFRGNKDVGWIETVDWYAKQAQKLKNKCENHIRKHLADDIVQDDGTRLVAAHYRCGEMQVRSSNRGYRPYMKLYYFHPIFKTLTLEDIAEKKCEKLQGCFENAKTSPQIDWVYQMQIQLGCQ